MATHKQVGSAGSNASWIDVDFIAIVRVSAGEIVILNSDGTETRLYSSSGSFAEDGGVLSGTVTSMARTGDGGMVYESVGNLSIGVADLISGGGSLFDVVLETAVSLTLNPWHDQPATGTDIAAWTGHAGLGGAGFGIADYAAADTGVVAYLDKPHLNGGAAAGDVYHSIGGLTGSGFDDVLGGNAGANLLAGNGGNDTLAGGLGADTLDGGAGTDVADYSSEASAVTVDLADSSLNAGGAAGDVLRSVENVVGSTFDDWLGGDAGDNVLVAAQGDDVISLGGGNDILAFASGDGADTVLDFGVAGFDTIMLTGYAGITSFAQLLEEQMLVTSAGHAAILLSGGDSIALQNVASHTLLTASNFQF